MSAASEVVSCKEHDYLEQDPDIRGQKFFCMSTISPESVLKQKDVFVLNKFFGSVAADMTEFFDNMKEKFRDDSVVVDMLQNIRDRHAYICNETELAKEFEFFKESKNKELEEEFSRIQNFTTTIRGIKVRGVYETIDEARKRAQKLSQIDKSFNIYIGQVGCWCPWSPVADEIEDQEWAETQLNTLMKKYKEGEDLKEELYRIRKDDMIAKASIHPPTTIAEVGESTGEEDAGTSSSMFDAAEIPRPRVDVIEEGAIEEGAIEEDAIKEVVAEAESTN